MFWGMACLFLGRLSIAPKPAQKSCFPSFWFFGLTPNRTTMAAKRGEKRRRRRRNLGKKSQGERESTKPRRPRPADDIIYVLKMGEGKKEKVHRLVQLSNLHHKEMDNLERLFGQSIRMVLNQNENISTIQTCVQYLISRLKNRIYVEKYQKVSWGSCFGCMFVVRASQQMRKLLSD